MVSQEEAVMSFKGMLKTRNVPHILLYGPPGTGKTSIALAFAKELFGESHFRNRILELNASDDRGISKIREKVGQFLTKGETLCGDQKRADCEQAGLQDNFAG